MNLFVLVILASMWNLLAGYGGLVSIGLQAFIGVGAYSLLWLSHIGVGVYVAIPLAALMSAAAALPHSPVFTCCCAAGSLSG